MCGLAGVIFGKKRRTQTERDTLTWYFTRLLVLSEQRGPHASGLAWLKRDGDYRLFKRPVTASQLIVDKAFHEMLCEVDNKTTLLMGHTRWRTRGDERKNRNNHPIRVRNVIGTHNGTIYNANYLFRRFNLPRFAEVDSEILFRMAATASRSGRLDLNAFRQHLRLCRGQISAIIGSVTDPETVVILKGNKPLEMRYHEKKRAFLYASDARYLDAVLAQEKGWMPVRLPPMRLAVLKHDTPQRMWLGALDFVVQGGEGSAFAPAPLMWDVDGGDE
jgi:glucosamine 6-phosphate synthetase-like amidotransferase/phosphosugar isomerase protein